tara:strand:- start:5710 stop:5892 length:183 start_codon:yes stop_codon:yes gene_type:complete
LQLITKAYIAKTYNSKPDITKKEQIMLTPTSLLALMMVPVVSMLALSLLVSFIEQKAFKI